MGDQQVVHQDTFKYFDSPKIVPKYVHSIQGPKQCVLPSNRIWKKTYCIGEHSFIKLFKGQGLEEAQWDTCKILPPPQNWSKELTPSKWVKEDLDPMLAALPLN